MADRSRPGVRRLERLGLAVAASLVSVNIWTGAPLFAVWIGSRVAPASGTSTGAIALVLVVLAVLEFLLASALTRLNATYDRLTGRDAGIRRTTPWLRSMRAEREQLSRERVRVSPIERIAVLSVVTGVLAFEVWFFFFARYSISGV
jgi:hypothetical protein